MRLACIGALGLAVGIVAVVAGALPFSDVVELGQRIGPIMAFLAGISVIVNLSAKAGVFAVLASLATRAAGGRTWLLWSLVLLLAVLCTAFLSLDTTAVLLTPLVLAVVRSAELRPLAFVLPIIWLANTASLFLPVSNLTNLLAAETGTMGTPAQFLGAMFPPGAAAVAATALVAVLFFRKDLAGRHRVVGIGVAGDRTAFGACALVLVVVLPLLLSTIPYWITTTAGAAVLLVVFTWRARASVGFHLVPWHILLFAIGLMAAARVLLSLPVAGFLQVPGVGFPGTLGLAAMGALGANLLNNLPAYLVLEPHATSPALLQALLIGVNVGPLATPWASLATLLWHDQLRRQGIDMGWGRFCLLGLLLAPVAVLAALGAGYLAGSG